jgi:3-isopropylmalate dehydrogenase
LFEPVHGTAPDSAGRGIANPVATVLSACMMLEYIGYNREANEIQMITEQILNEGYTTPDIGGNETTQKVTDKIISRL